MRLGQMLCKLLLVSFGSRFVDLMFVAMVLFFTSGPELCRHNRLECC